MTKERLKEIKNKVRGDFFFNNPSKAEACIEDLVNYIEKLEKEIESAPTVYTDVFHSIESGVVTDWFQHKKPAIGDTHTAKLVRIREIEG